MPLRVGESLTIESKGEGGVLLFRTTLRARRIDPYVLIVEKPSSISKIERRTEVRENRDGQRILLDGEVAYLRDVSAHGAAIRPLRPLAKGERIRLDLPWLEAPVYGWVIGEPEKELVRTRLETEIALR